MKLRRLIDPLFFLLWHSTSSLSHPLSSSSSCPSSSTTFLSSIMKLQQLPVFLFITTLSSASPLNFQRRGDSQYPASDEVPDISLTPQSWTDALNSAKCELDGLLPSPLVSFAHSHYLQSIPSQSCREDPRLFSFYQQQWRHQLLWQCGIRPGSLFLDNFEVLRSPWHLHSSQERHRNQWVYFQRSFPERKANVCWSLFSLTLSFFPPPFFLLRPSPCLSGLSPLAVSLLSQALTMDQLRLRLISTTSWARTTKAVLISYLVATCWTIPTRFNKQLKGVISSSLFIRELDSALYRFFAFVIHLIRVSKVGWG